MKKIITFLALVIIATGAMAQAPYVLTYYTQPYVPLTGATSANAGAVWVNEGTVYTMPMPFSAKIGPTIVNRVFNEGNVTLADTTSTNTHVDLFQWVFTTTTDRGTGTTVSKSPLRYTTTGATPSRIFKVEDFNVGFAQEKALYHTLNDSFSCQLWIYETSNIIEIHFGDSRITHAADYFGCIAVPSDSPAFCGYGNANFTTGLFNYAWVAAGDQAAPWLDSFNSSTAGYPNYTKPMKGWPVSGTVYRFAPAAYAAGIAAAESNKLAAAIYPNPSDGKVSVKIPSQENEAEITISDITGRVVETRSITNNTGEPVQFDLPKMAAVYVVKVICRDASYVDKIIVR